MIDDKNFEVNDDSILKIRLHINVYFTLDKYLKIENNNSILFQNTSSEIFGNLFGMID